MIFERAVAVICNYSDYSDIKRLLSNCLSAGIWSQELVNKALIQAMDVDRYSWAQTWNKDFQAVPEPRNIDRLPLEKLTGCPSCMSVADAGSPDQV